MSSMARHANKSIVLGIVVLGGVLVGLSAYVYRLTTREGGSENTQDQISAGGLDAVRGSIASLVGKDRWEAAGKIAGGAVRQYPGDRELRVQYAQVLQGLKRFDEAYEQYAQALAIGPADAATAYLAGLCANSAGMMEEALSNLELARTREPKNARYALELGLVQFNAGLMDEARASLTVARQLDPNSAIAWGMLAQIALKKGERSIALQYVTKARELDPQAMDWRVVEARAIVRDDPQRAATLLDGVRVEALRRPDVRSVLRSAYGAMGEFGRVAEIFAKASDAEPSSVDLALETADLFDRAGQRERAIEYAQRAAIMGGDEARGMLARLQQAGDG